MATLTTILRQSRASEPVLAPLPGGIWADLARAAEAPTKSAGDVWRGLERRLTLDREDDPTGMWNNMAVRVDPAQYRPHAVPDVAEEQLTEGEQTFTVIRSPRGNYLRLTEPERAIWHEMDGSRTVAQLGTAAFFRFKQLILVADLVEHLKSEGFLMEAPVRIYSALTGRLQAQTAEGWSQRLIRTLGSLTWRIERVDRLFDLLYRFGGKLLFTPLFIAAWAVLIGCGLAFFMLGMIADRQNSQLLALNGSFELGLAALWAALLVSFVLHEAAHALAVKHYRRTVLAGGLMLYYGMPAAFVDTSDIWRSPRRARIIVSAAGPMADLFFGSLAAILAWFLPDTTGGALAFKVAFISFVSVIFNLNPLLELDGYFMLVDALRLPDLRQRAFSFLRGPFWQQLRARKPFKRDERIFTLFGTLALIYSAFSIVTALLFWNEQILGPIVALLNGNLVQQVLGWLLLLVGVVPVVLGILLAAWGAVRAGINWLVRQGYGRRPDLLAIGAGAIIALLGLVTLWQYQTLLPALLPPLLWLVALGALLALRPDYRGAAIAPSLAAFVLTTAFAALASIQRALAALVLLPNFDGLTAVRMVLTNPAIWIIADGMALTALMLAGFAILLDVDLRVAPARELIATVIFLIGAFLVGGVALMAAQTALPQYSNIAYLAVGAPAYFGAVAAALMLPHLLGLRDSRLFWSWALFWTAVLFEVGSYLAQILNASAMVSAVHSGFVGTRAPVVDVLAAGLWAAAWLVHLATMRQIAPDEIRWPHEASISEARRLLRAFQFSYAGCYRLLRAIYGERRTKVLDDRMDVLAATANWDVTLDLDRARVGAAVLSLPIDEQGKRYAEVLRYSVATIEEIAGAAFARRAIQAAYDALPWPERETASRLCFPETPWAQELSSGFGDAQAVRLRLLRQVDLFLNCDDDELQALARNVRELSVSAGITLLREGNPSPGVWIIEAGEVISRQDGVIQEELHRGDAFGADELLHDRMSALDYRTTVNSSLLFIPAEDFRSLTAKEAPHAAAALDSVEMLRLLERVPLFASMPRHVLRELGHIAQQREIEARSVIVTQGKPSGVFYIIKQGEAAILVADGVGPDGKRQVREVARVGPQEFVGEMELLHGTPPVASVFAVTPMVVLVLPHDKIRAILNGHDTIARALDQISSGRKIALRERAVSPVS